jgi:GT2 family glycosyltransferase
MVDILPGSVLFFPRVILSRVGFFDASMKLFYSDTDFSIRVRKSHYAVVHIGTTSVLHIRQATTKLLSSTTTNSLWKHDKQRFYTKYYGSIVGFLSSFPL